MTNWDDLRFLVALSKTGTMTAAAKILGTNTATVSRRIDRLSETLGMPAFIKTGDGWRPSEAVSPLIQLAQNFDGELQATLNSRPVNNTAEPVTISLGSVPIITALVLFPGLKRHHRMLDGIRLDFSDRMFREGLGENDLVIQFIRPAQGRIIARKVGSLTFRFYRYREGGCLENWAGLSGAHDEQALMRFGHEAFGRAPRLRVDHVMALHRLMQETRLPGPLPDILAAQDPELVPLQPDTPTQTEECWLFYHESRRNDPGIRRTLEWVTTCFEALDQAAQTIPAGQ
ncbi:LysR family transcriptional regulator [Salipiger abyssi]|uniref:LysR family transcriptional regulator n=1 Tax=Salipiger abyssi TaxID=1250539 RepID=UPI001A8C0D06|nr:LysR family transcriptional regulator [Salipiger abyssi]MBN9889105.1 LysR family transcriptional regulator [Salipiger abyssi]